MYWQGKLDLGIGIREGALLSAYILGFFSYWSYRNGMEFGWQFFLAAAGISLSVWVTLEVIERAIREDRERQWQKIKSLTYMNIINNIRYIVTRVPLDTGNAIDCINLINGEINYPAEFTTNIILDLAKELRAEYGFNDDDKDIDDMSDEELRESEGKEKNLHAFYKSIIYLIEDIKTNLIPRTLLLSSDSEVNLALTRFDAFIRDFQEEIKYSWDLPETSNLIALLLDELASVYDVLQRKMPPRDGDNPYRFKVPSPFY